MYFTKEKYTETIDYVYNDNGTINKTKTVNLSTSELVNTEYLYNESNLVSFKRILNKENILTGIYQYEYKNHSINFGSYRRVELE